MFVNLISLIMSSKFGSEQRVHFFVNHPMSIFENTKSRLQDVCEFDLSDHKFKTKDC